MLLLALVVLLVVPNGFVCLQCIPENKHEAMGEGSEFDLEDLLGKRSISTGAGTNRMIPRACHVHVSYIPMLEKVVVQYFGDSTPYEIVDELVVSTSFTVMEGGGVIQQNDVNYVCSSHDYCETDFVENWISWLKTFDNYKLEWRIEQVLEPQFALSSESGICYNNGRVQNCPSKVCSVALNKTNTSNRCAPRTDDVVIALAQQPAVAQYLIGIVMVLTSFDTTVLNLHQIKGDLSRILFAKQFQNQHIVYYCMRNTCNEESVVRALLPVVNESYTLESVSMRQSVNSKNAVTSLLSLIRSK